MKLDSHGGEYGSMAGSCEQGNEHSGPIKDGKFLGILGDFQFHKNDSCSMWLLRLCSSITKKKNCTLCEIYSYNFLSAFTSLH
jgi:hypothetical protein